MKRDCLSRRVVSPKTSGRNSSWKGGEERKGQVDERERIGTGTAGKRRKVRKEERSGSSGGALTACLALERSSIWTCRSSISASMDLRALTAAAQVNSDSSSWMMGVKAELEQQQQHLRCAGAASR